MGTLLYLMVAVYIHGKIGTEVIRYAVCIPVGIQGSLRTIVIIAPDGQGNGPSGAVGGIHGKTEAMVHPEITDQRYIMRLIIIGRIVFSFVYYFPGQRIVHF